MSAFLIIIAILIFGVFFWHGYLASGAVGNDSKAKTSATRNFVLFGGIALLFLVQLVTPRSVGQRLSGVGYLLIFAVFFVMLVKDIRRRRVPHPPASKQVAETEDEGSASTHDG